MTPAELYCLERAKRSNRPNVAMLEAQRLYDIAVGPDGRIFKGGRPRKMSALVAGAKAKGAILIIAEPTP